MLLFGALAVVSTIIITLERYSNKFLQIMIFFYTLSNSLVVPNAKISIFTLKTFLIYNYLSK